MRPPYNMRTYFPENDTQRPALPDSSESDYAYYGSEEERVQLLDYWKNLVKRRRIIIQIFIIFLLVGAYFTFTATPVYKATATLKIEPIRPTPRLAAATSWTDRKLTKTSPSLARASSGITCPFYR